jgi:hypothetical protein
MLIGWGTPFNIGVRQGVENGLSCRATPCRCRRRLWRYCIEENGHACIHETVGRTILSSIMELAVGIGNVEVAVQCCAGILDAFVVFFNRSQESTERSRKQQNEHPLECNANLIQPAHMHMLKLNPRPAVHVTPVI